MSATVIDLSQIVNVTDAAPQFRDVIDVYSTAQVDNYLSGIQLMPGPQGQTGPNLISTVTASTITGVLYATGGFVSNASANIVNDWLGQAKAAEEITTPTATSATINLTQYRHQTLSLTSATGTVAVTITPPGTRAIAGTIVIQQHSTTPRDFTVATTGKTTRWAGEKPNFATYLAAGKKMSLAWRYDGADMMLFPSEVMT